jgi:hypothetical protein
LRYFFRRYIPPFTRVLLVESGSRGAFDTLVPLLYQIYGEAMELDLVTCHATTPVGFRGRVYRVEDYSSPAARRQLFRELASRDYAALGILCSGEPIMTKWKWALAARLPAKVFVINEFAGFLWLDWGQARNLAAFPRVRFGLSGAAALPAVARLLLLPFTLIYLLLFAAIVHTKRRIRISS